MKKSFTLFIAMMMPLFLFGESYSSLWKKVSEAEQKDLPKTEYELLQKIVKKASKDKAYGQLLKAELQGAQVMAEIAPDSLKPAVERIRERGEAAKDEVLRMVYQTVLYNVCSSNSPLGIEVSKPDLTIELCEKLAKVKDKTYRPFIIQGADAGIFNYDLLSVVGYELDEYRMLHEFYEQKGNRRAACITAVEAYKYADVDELDSVISCYADLPEAGELAIARYNRIGYKVGVTAGDKVKYIREALSKWGTWPRMQILRDKMQELTNPQFEVEYNQEVVLPQQEQTVTLKNLRNVSSLTMTVYKMNCDGDVNDSPSTAEGYRKLKGYIGEVALQEERQYTGKEDYELFDDTFTFKGLPVGVYLVEFNSQPYTQVVRRLYYVTDVYTIAEPQPKNKGTRYVVVSATTGQPLAGAHLRLTETVSYLAPKVTNADTNAQGEYIYKTDNSTRRCEVFAYTDTDKACPVVGLNGRYNYYENDDQSVQTCIYTDRSIYRPGQTVHVSALLYQVDHGIHQETLAAHSVKFTLRDANYKVVGEQTAGTDAYGVCAVDFTLPASGLTGRYTIQANDQNLTIRVEEYKRPTFHVDFPEVKEAYAAGETLQVQATAMSYAGVPVQGAKVSYKVVRRTAYWWWSYSRYWNQGMLGYSQNGDELLSEETTIDDEGHFTVKVPFEMPSDSQPMFYNFVVMADVTDTAGETHSGQLSLPLGNRKQVFSVDMEEQVLLEDQPTATFHLLNAAGKDLDAEVEYQVDGGARQKVRTNTQLSILNTQLSSGKHTLTAVCEGDSIERSFVLFSLDDKQPATETDDWSYQSASQFANDGQPVTIQVGSSDKDVHIVYSIFSGDKVIEQGAVDKTNALINRKLTYKEEYGDGLLLTFAWVKNSKCYTHTMKISRPMPDKRLQLEWSTFRDRLTPGQKEEWTLTIKGVDGKPADAQLMAALYDKSLDQIYSHNWSLQPYYWLSLPATQWSYATHGSLHSYAMRAWQSGQVKNLMFSQFDKSVFPSYYQRSFRRFANRAALGGEPMVVYESAMADIKGRAMAEPEPPMLQKTAFTNDAIEAENDAAAEPQEEQVQVRENLSETAFFYPQLTTDKNGCVALKFTLPESLTTWRFLGLAHTTDMCYGSIEGEAIAQKDVMIQPNVPRFLREGDEGSITARIFNTGKKTLAGTAMLKLIDPETNKVVLQQKQTVSLKGGQTSAVSFSLNLSRIPDHSSLLICQMVVSGKGFSDGEQHYLPILPSTQRVTVTMPITQHKPGTETVNLAALFPTTPATDKKLTIEYTNNPAWLMTLALPTVGTAYDDNAISQAAAYYANSIGKYIIDQQPEAKAAFALWKQEKSSETTLMSALEKNQELKEIVLNETPWVLDADRETEQRQRMADFFDENLMQNRLNGNLEKLRKLQLADGSWTWWKDMPGSFYMTVAVSEMLVRLNAMTGVQSSTRQMLDGAFSFMGNEIVEEVAEMKKWEKEGHEVSFPSFKCLQWLYLSVLDGRSLPSEVAKANKYLLALLKKDIKRQSIYEKALTAVILSKSDAQRAKEYAQSLKEYTVYREDMGRYYDTPRAGYSWYDYKIPTQTVAIEALQRLTPDDEQTIIEMQRWLLQQKRTQAWDTPINSVNAVYAFLGGNSQQLSVDTQKSSLAIDGKPLQMPKATAAIGYVKTTVPAISKKLTVKKTSEGTSWGAVYAQFNQPTKDIADSGSGITVKREILGNLKVGGRIKTRITITADRNYDFVQVIDKRAACMEPVRQLSGYHNGSYCAPKDNATYYYFDCLSKGQHVIENEYFIDRAGTYETGACIVECAYSPEFRAVTKSQTLKIVN